MSYFEKIQKALEKRNNKGYDQPLPKISEVVWKANEGKAKDGKNIVRLVMNDSMENFFFTVKIYDFGVLEKYPILSPNTITPFSDPIQKETKKLRDSKDEASIQLAKKFNTRDKLFAPVIVRGEEDKGVQLWEIPINKIDNLITVLSNPKYGDILDETNGRDLEITTKKTSLPSSDPKKKSFEYNEIISILPDFSTSRLGTDEQIEEWKSNIPDVNKFYSEKTSDELMDLFKAKLKELVGDFEDSEEENEESEPEREEKQVTSNEIDQVFVPEKKEAPAPKVEKEKSGVTKGKAKTKAKVEEEADDEFNFEAQFDED